VGPKMIQCWGLKVEIGDRVSCTESTQMQASLTRPQLSYKTLVWSGKGLDGSWLTLVSVVWGKDGCCNIHERIYFELAAPIWGLLTRSSMACARPEIVHKRLVCSPSLLNRYAMQDGRLRSTVLVLRL